MAASLVEGVGDDLGDVHGFDGGVTFKGCYCLLEHLDAERTGGGRDVSFCVDGFPGTHLIDPAPGLLLHPHPAAASATAEALGPDVLHFQGLAACGCLQDVSRGLIDVVVSAEIAGVVIGHALVKLSG